MIYSPTYQLYLIAIIGTRVTYIIFVCLFERRRIIEEKKKSDIAKPLPIFDPEQWVVDVISEDGVRCAASGLVREVRAVSTIWVLCLVYC